MSPPTVVHTARLVKRYGDTVALRGVDLEIEPGAVVGLLGPNGAGKTTLVEILEGLRVPTEGAVRVFGLDPRRDSLAVRERIGVQLQHTSFPDTLTVREVLRLFASFYAASASPDEMMGAVGLEEKADAFTRELSGGQKQRLALGMALVNRPDFLILDEPTAGLDPAARRALHDMIRGLGGEGRTILLTTHYTDEAEKLCDRVLMLRDGRVVADGSPFELVGKARGASRLWVAVEGELDPTPLVETGARLEGREGEYLCFTTPRPAETVMLLGRALAEQGLSLTDLRVKRPTLEDVYMEVMGEGPTGPGGPPGPPPIPADTQPVASRERFVGQSG